MHIQDDQEEWRVFREAVLHRLTLDYLVLQNLYENSSSSSENDELHFETAEHEKLYDETRHHVLMTMVLAFLHRIHSMNDPTFESIARAARVRDISIVTPEVVLWLIHVTTEAHWDVSA